MNYIPNAGLKPSKMRKVAMKKGIQALNKMQIYTDAPPHR